MAYHYKKDRKMFSTSKTEVMQLLVGMGEATILQNAIKISNYPFEPSTAFAEGEFRVADISDVDITSFPPTMRVRDELIFISAKQKEELSRFAIENNIKIVNRPPLWDWILAPFLDTEFTEETDQRLNALLNEYGLIKEDILSLRKEVETQMLKYNFDTMLWEWGMFGAYDVLSAMRPKYDREQFRDFYGRVMKIALLSGK